MRALIVDDSKAIHAFMRVIFQELGYALTEAYDGSEAVRLFQEDPKAIDIVLLDWEMPIMSGPETLVALRGISSTVPIIMVTTKNDIASITEAMGKGATEYVMKPFTKDILIDKIDMTLRNKVA